MVFFRWLRATLGGYFWLPCPICGRNFGGFETAGGTGLMTSWSSGKCVCKKCKDEADRRNEKFMEENTFDKSSLENFDKGIK